MGRTGVGTLCLWLCAVCLVHGQNYVNVALNKNYSQSSKYQEIDSPSWAANGNTDGVYSVGGGNCIHTAVYNDPNPWWEVDLGRTYPVHNITVWPRTNFTNRLYPSDIRVDSQLCASINNMDARKKNVVCPSVMYGQTVRITRQGTGSIILNLCEMQIWVPHEVSECEAGRYGTSCDRNCSDNCGKGPGKNFCDQSSGYCYDGCVSGWYGDQCSTACSPGCQNTTCGQSGQCSPCRAHYTGDKCSECVSGWYGDQCSTACSPGCQDTCDQQSGHCSCKAGHTGDTCTECEDTHYNTSSGTCVQCSANCMSQSCEDQTGKCNGCVSGWYGDQCSCSPGCQNTTCDQQSGNCSCKAGYTGDTCTECVSGWYGDQCSTACSTGCRNTTCDQQSGQCTCKAGYTGDTCTGCVSGWYGDKCPCSPGCQNTTCDQQSGNCSCKAGYTGDTCTECVSGWYGDQCSTACSTGCQNTTCDQQSGQCTCKAGYTGDACTEIKDGINIALVAGAAGAAVLVIIIVVVTVVFIMRRRRRGTKARGLESGTSNTAQNAEQQEEPERPASSPLSFTPVVDSGETKAARPKALVKPVQADVAKPKPTEADGNVYQNVSSPQRTSVSTSPATSLAQTAPENGTATSESRPLSEPLTDYEELEDLWGGEEPIYSNDPAYTNFIRVDQLQKTIVDSLQDGKVAQEFSFMAGFKQYPATIGRREESKNRFKSIVPYDRTRVILDQVDGDDTSDYINASFVKGYKNEKAYIAAQGPKSNTQDDFWRMVWQEGVTDIVMLTNLKEGNKAKCHEYWPAKGTSVNTGHMEVTGLEEEERAHFVIRTFNVQQLQNQEQRQVRQYHYIKWMDHEVPSTTPLVNFWRYVRARAPRTPTAPPLLVHCSAGVGRTGTYIALDILIDQTQEQEEISLYYTVDNLRKYRCHMVQNKSQYEFLHEAVLEAYMSGDCRLQTSSFDHVYPSPIHHDQPHPRIDDEFRRLCLMRTCQTRPSHTVASLEENRHKNRNPDALPDDDHLVYITEHTRGRNQYINAVYLPTFLSSRGSIVTQLPLADTVIDLWRLVDSWNVSTIVSVGQVEGGKGMSRYWPKALGQPVKCGAYVISMKSVNPLGDTLHSYTVEMKKQNQSRELRVLHYEAWTGQVADNVSDLFRLLDTLHTSHTQSTKEPIVIQCIDGVAQSGAVCALWDVISRMTCDGEVDVYQAVRHVHTVRPEAVTSVVQYRFIFEMTQQYRNTRSMYANM